MNSLTLRMTTVAMLTLLWLTAPVMARTLTLAVDSRYWYPFTYMNDQKAAGMHIDMVKQALSDLGYGFVILPYPRKRCLYQVETGSVDGMISVAYHEALSAVLIFPADAGMAAESQWRIMQVDHVAVTCNPDYDYDGIPAHLPVPVRLPVGEALVHELTRAGLFVDDARTDLQNFRKMLRDRTGSVITSSVLAEKMAGDPDWSGIFHISPTPVSSQSYFLAFSKGSRLTQDERTAIWTRIKELRDDYAFMLRLFSQY
ncbi:hypothetical protein JCM14469_29120 [Desulfatiferula olefinivorans]